MPRRTSAMAIAWACLLSAAGAQTPGNGLQMSPAQAFPHAGVVLAAPAAFEFQPAREMYDVLRAVQRVEGRVVHGMTLSAYPIDAGMTAEQFSEATLRELSQNLALTRLAVHQTAPMHVAGIDGLARSLSYVWRGQPTAAARVYFVRRLGRDQGAICYVLTVESLDARREQLLAILGSVVRSVRLVPVQAAMDAAPSEAGVVLQRPAEGYAVRLPHGWHLYETHDGVAMAMVDYTRGGAPTVAAQIKLAGAQPGATPQTRAEEQLRGVQRLAAQRGMEIAIVHQGQVTLAQRPGWGFTLRQTPRAGAQRPAGQPDAVVINRVIDSDTTAGRLGRSYTLSLVCQGATPEAASALMDQLAAGFVLLPPTAGQEASPPERPRPAAPAESWMP